MNELQKVDAFLILEYLYKQQQDKLLFEIKQNLEFEMIVFTMLLWLCLRRTA